MLIVVSGETHYLLEWVGLIMKIILSIFGVIFLSVSSSAGIEEGELDRTGLECEVSHKEYERDSVLKYFIFEGGEVYWLLPTDGDPARISKFSHGRYLANDNDVRWYPYILDRKSLRLNKLRPSYPSREHHCRAMKPTDIKKILQKKIDEFNGE
jgi:hypothetical protein